MLLAVGLRTQFQKRLAKRYVEWQFGSYKPTFPF
jgi:hypothetical protein